VKQVISASAIAGLAIIGLFVGNISASAIPGCPSGYVWNSKFGRCIKIGVYLDSFGNELPERVFVPTKDGTLKAVRLHNIIKEEK
jgi:hypothetical protein